MAHCCPFLSPDPQDGASDGRVWTGHPPPFPSSVAGPGVGAERGLRRYPVVLDGLCLRVRGVGRSSSKIRESSHTGRLLCLV